MSHRRRRLAALVAGGALALVFAGCGIAIQGTAQPFKVPANQFTPPTTPTIARHHGRAYDVFFLTNGYLVASTRFLPAGRFSLNQRLQLALNQLDAGPTAAEFRSGVTTSLSESPAATVTLVGHVKNHIATVDLDSTFSELDTSQLFQADGQILYTLTQFHAVNAVNMLLGGIRIAYLPNGNAISDRPVDRVDYRSIAPPTKP
ncbi:MAG TPA: GerMN domain-containing protein [Acidimicrobiales bacterium]|nr:GerMN domain-containing protein [Acidimicrobiales bacterium]